MVGPVVLGASQATMRTVIGKLVEFLAKEYTAIRGARGDVQYITDELASMNAFLDHLDNCSTKHSVQTQDWRKQVRDMAYDVEDTVDEYARKFPNDPRGGGCCNEFKRWLYDCLHCWPRRDIAAKFAEIKSRAEQVGARRQRYGVSNPEVAGGSAVARAKASSDADNQLDERELVRIKEPVGMKKELKEDFNGRLEKWNKVVLCLHGSGGIGKTTIAKELYQQHEHKFDVRAMVTVSQSSDLEAILGNILSQIKDRSDQKQGGVSDAGSSYCCDFVKSMFRRNDRIRQERGAELKGKLKDKSYLLLIDDVWSTTMWNDIKNYLPNNLNQRTVIIVTTRFKHIATECLLAEREIGLEHQVIPLLPREAEELFKNEIQSSQLPKIWEVCKGLPLAIVTMAGHVACNSEKSPKYWDDLRDSLLPESAQSLTQEEVTTMLLDYCFLDMSADLRNCTLYLSVFPKGRKISRKRLTRRWIAEGLVSEKDGSSAEDVADTIFKHLIRRKIIRPVDHNKNGKVKTCQTHDMVLEYIVSKSREDNFITVVGGHWTAPVGNSKVRRLSIQSNDSKHATLARKMNLDRLRSLTVFGSSKQLPAYTFKIGLVQVLDLEDCKDFKKRNINNVFEMVLLKYLSLRGTNIDVIPKSIGNLQYLETLDIRETDVTLLPKAIGQLRRLANILGGDKIGRKAFKLPEGLNKETMRALRILSGIEVIQESSVADNLTEFTGLRKLVIYKLKITDEKSVGLFSSAIEYLGIHSLRSLTIDDDNDSNFLASLSDLSAPPRSLHALELSGNLPKLPRWISELKDLKKLTLPVTVLRMDTLELLCELPLFSLTFSFSSSKWKPDLESILKGNESIEGVITVNGKGFKGLNLLSLSAPLLPSLNFSQNAMPNLQRLELRFKKFEGLIGLSNLRSLKQVNLTMHVKASKTTKMKVDDLRKIAQECHPPPKVIQAEHHE